MTNRRFVLLSVLLTLIWSGLWARPYPVRLWQIGKAHRVVDLRNEKK